MVISLINFRHNAYKFHGRIFHDANNSTLKPIFYTTKYALYNDGNLHLVCSSKMEFRFQIMKLDKFFELSYYFKMNKRRKNGIGCTPQPSAMAKTMQSLLTKMLLNFTESQLNEKCFRVQQISLRPEFDTAHFTYESFGYTLYWCVTYRLQKRKENKVIYKQ